VVALAFFLFSSMEPAEDPGPAAVAIKAEKFHRMQLRSVLDKIDSSPDRVWGQLLASGNIVAHAATKIQLALPGTAVAEASLCDMLKGLSQAFEVAGSGEAFARFYRRLGWTGPEDFFCALGECPVMVVDVDHNDSDDRLAIIILTYLVASANSERRQHRNDARCSVLLDARTYERDGLTMWRTLQLASRLNSALMEAHGVSVEPVLTDREQILNLVAGYLRIPAETLDERAPGVGAMLRSEGRGGTRSSLRGCWRAGSAATLWLLGGLCEKQVEDIEHGLLTGVHFTIFEQAQPAWQSMRVEGLDVQPDWSFPPDPEAEEHGFGAEPSNVRSSEETYPDTIATYMRLQQIIASTPSAFNYVFPALARNDQKMPVPPGRAMFKISGRPLNVLPGTTYTIKKAVDAHKLDTAFSQLLLSARTNLPETIYAELCIGTADYFGQERDDMGNIRKYGTFMADPILVCLAATPLVKLGAIEMTRRLAFVRL